MLTITDLHVYYGAIHALKGVSLTVAEGEIVTLIGANGAGKSTTLRAISGLVPVREGKIDLQGTDLTRQRAHAIAAGGVGHAPEGRRIFPNLTVAENLDLGAYARWSTRLPRLPLRNGEGGGRGAREDRATIATDLEEVLDLFPRLRERLRQQAGTLSGGEQQMLAIGRALMGRPRLLLLDEPSLGLAPFLVKEIFRIVQEINRRGTTVLLVEQNAHMALDVAHRGYVLETGHVVLADTGRALLANPQVREAYLGEG
jgi:branched-chain amino acid transport system ATP-binding protein